jgi:hypothetical protein
MARLTLADALHNLSSSFDEHFGSWILVTELGSIVPIPGSLNLTEEVL